MIWRTIRRSRRVRYCSRGGCERRVIAIGDSYLSCVASPHHDDLGNTRWWRLVECESCAKRNGNWPNPTRPEGERSMSRYAEHTLTLHCHHDMATWGHYDPETGEYTEADGCWLMSWWEACWNDLLAVKGPIASLPIPVRPSDDWGADGGTIVLDERPVRVLREVGIARRGRA